MNKRGILARLEYLRREILAERISYMEIQELHELRDHIDPDDTLLREWAGIPEKNDAKSILFRIIRFGV